jgi:DNA replication protein DnaC
MKRICGCGKEYKYTGNLATEYDSLFISTDKEKKDEVEKLEALKKKLDFEMLLTPNICPDCLRERNEAMDTAPIQEDKQDDENVKLEALGIRPRHYACTFDNFEIENEKGGIVLKACKRMAERRKGLIVMYGNNGVGKTHLLSATVKEIGAGKIFKMIEIGMFIRKYIGSQTLDEQSQLDYLIRLPFLAIDEFEKSKRSDSELIWLSYIIDERNERYRPTILSGNCHPDKIHADGKRCEKCFEAIVTPDILDRIAQFGTLHYLDGESHRKGLRGKE